jgi:hypothetical protein
MSHFTTIKTEIRDRVILLEALEGLKVRFQENGTLQGHQNQRQTADLVIQGRVRPDSSAEDGNRGGEVNLKESGNVFLMRREGIMPGELEITIQKDGKIEIKVRADTKKFL